MKKIINIFLVICFFALAQTASCNQNDELFASLDKANSGWVESFNRNQGDVSKHYIDRAVLFLEKGASIKGNQEIANYYIENYRSISKVTSIHVNGRFLEANLVYEIGYFSTDNGDEYHYIISWQKRDDTWLREFEIVAKKIPNNIDPVEIDKARENWVKLCNAHDSKKLVESLYQNNAVYYNRGRIIQGWEEISSEYQYMNYSYYNLNLKPKIIKVIQPDLAFEIGECSGSYPGHYILRWQKEPTGEWKISLDSNY